MINGVQHVFCVPGESYLAVLDAFHDRKLAVTVCRQEGGAAMMAEAVGKATGAPGICFVTRGPGATNASAGIHIAQQNSSPMIMFVGQVTRDIKDREALQELDLRAVFGSMTKWTAEIDDPARVPEIVSRAFYTATSGRPGPVVMGLPEDMLVERTTGAERARLRAGGDLAGRARDAQACGVAGRRGSAPWRFSAAPAGPPDACAAIRRFAERFDLPVATSYRRLPLFDPLHACYAGNLGIGPNPKLLARFKDADLILLIGGRMGEIPSQAYALMDIPGPRRGSSMCIRAPRSSAGSIGRIWPSTPRRRRLRPPRRCCSLQVPSPGASAPGRPTPITSTGPRGADPQPGAVNLGAVMVWLRENLPLDAILCNGAGNYAAWIHRFYRFRNFATHIAPTSASMGYGMPSAVAMQRLYPDRTVVCLNGDGDFLMNGQEFATAVMYELPIVVIVADNGIYGTIRMHQERDYPGRVSGDLPAQSRLLRLCARLRRFRRHGRAHRGFRRRIPGRRSNRVSRRSSTSRSIPRRSRRRTTLSRIREQALASATLGKPLARYGAVWWRARSRLAEGGGRPSN